MYVKQREIKCENFLIHKSKRDHQQHNFQFLYRCFWMALTSSLILICRDFYSSSWKLLCLELVFKQTRVELISISGLHIKIWYKKREKLSSEKLSAYELHVLYRCPHMSCTSISDDVHLYEDTKRSLLPPQQWEAKMEETPNMHLGYKLGAVSITMYINSHTSF